MRCVTLVVLIRPTSTDSSVLSGMVDSECIIGGILRDGFIGPFSTALVDRTS